jgi:hypothetical protein
MCLTGVKSYYGLEIARRDQLDCDDAVILSLRDWSNKIHSKRC